MKQSYAEFRAEVYEERVNEVAGSPLCVVCGRPVGLGFDLHHWLVRRGHLPKRKQSCIHHRFNVVIVHPECHQEADGRKDEIREQQIARYGEDVIQGWLDSLPLKTSVSLWA